MKGGRFITNDGDMCVPNVESFVSKGLREAAETGKDAYVVFHSKHRSLGANDSVRKTPNRTYLNEVNYVSRLALLLFGGNLEYLKNALTIDGWLKFKVGDKGSNRSEVLLMELRKERDRLILRCLHKRDTKTASSDNDQYKKVLEFVKGLLAQE